jgi:hypothetical protein
LIYCLLFFSCDYPFTVTSASRHNVAALFQPRPTASLYYTSQSDNSAPGPKVW